MRTENVYALIRKDDLEWGGRNPIDEASAIFAPQYPEPLLALLRDSDPLIRLRGLSVFAWLGKKGFVVLDAALGCAEDTSPWARLNLTDGIMSYPEKLNTKQAHIVLKLIDDPLFIVRERVAAFLGFARQETIEAAIELLAEPQRVDHRRGLRLFDAQPSQAQALFDHAMAYPGIFSLFSLASIVRMARENRLPAAPNYDGDDYIGRGVQANVTRLVRIAQRERSKGPGPAQK